MRRDPNRVNVEQVATELSLSTREAYKALRRVEFLYPKTGNTWDARVIDMINALHGRPHRTLYPAEANWLADHTKKEST